MEYFGFLSLGVTLSAIGLRCYFSMKETAVPQEQKDRPLSPRARRVLESAISRRMLRYHRGLAQA